MDTLALLCNLHADGPATLQRLRRAGCDSLAALLRLEPNELAEHLDWNPQVAERFLREAQFLSERVTGEMTSEPELELEEDEELEPVPSFDEFDAADEDEDEDEEETWEEDEEDEELEEERPERVEAVLGAWRELDRTTPPEEPRQFTLPRPAPAPDAGLRPFSIAGLTPEAIRRLAEHGVTTLRGLIGLGDVELARALGLSFTRAKHLEFQAARALEGLPAATVAGADGPADSPAPTPPARPRPASIEAYAPPPHEPFETAGPFA